MNHVYRIVFNRALGMLQVASELASHRGGGRGGSPRRRPQLPALLALALMLASGGAGAQVAPGALPTGPNVVTGIGGITSDGTTMTVTQDQARALIRWDSFDIGTSAAVVFEQGAGHVALNQILDMKPSEVMGTLTATGTIFLINPHGIMFGQDATVNVGALVASTLGPADPDEFLESDGDGYVHDLFTWSEGATKGEVVNFGTIASADGNVILLGNGARNLAGANIDAGSGLAALLAGGEARIELVPGGQPVVRITGAATVVATPGPDSPPVVAAVQNSGTISASGGSIVLHGALAPDLLGNVVNNAGTLAAGGIGVDPDGTISLVATGGHLALGGAVDSGDGDTVLGSSHSVLLSGTVETGSLAAEGVRIVQTAGSVRASGASSLHAGQRVDVDGLANDFGGAVDVSGAQVYLRDANSISLGTFDVGSLYVRSGGAVSLGSGTASASLVADSAGGGISQAGAVAVAGETWLYARAGAITLGDAGNDFTGEVFIYGGAAVLSDANLLSLGYFGVDSLVATSAGTLSLGTGLVSGALSATSTSGDITQSNALQVRGDAAFSAVSGDITLTHADNDFRKSVSLSGGEAVIRDTDSLVLDALHVTSLDVVSGGALSLGGVVSGALSATSTSGGITQGSALDVGGASVLDAGSGDITLGHAANLFGSTVSLTGDAVLISAAGGLALDAVSGGSLSASSAGALSLGTSELTGDLSATGALGVAQAGALVVAGDSTIDGGSGAVTLDHAANDFVGVVSLAGDAVTINDMNSLRLGAVDAGSLAASALSIRLEDDATTTGDQQYTGALALDADIVLAAGGDVRFTSTVDGAHALSVQSGGAVGFAGALGGAVALDGLTVDADSFSAASTLDVAGDLAITTATGGIGQAAAFRVGGTSSFDAGGGAITLANAGNDFTGAVDLAGGTVTVRDVNTLTLGTVAAASLHASATTIGLASDISTSGEQAYDGALVLGADVALDAGGSVTFGATVDGAHALSVGAGAAAVFSGAVGGSTALAGLDVDTDTFSAASTLAVKGDLTIAVASGDITQADAFHVGGTSNFDAGSSDIVLTHAGNDFIGAVDLRGGAVSLLDANTLTLGTVDAASLHATAATIGLGSDITTSGDQHYDGALVLDGDVVLRAGGDVAFGATVDGAHRLSANAGGAVVFDAAVGGTTALSGLDVEAGSFDAASTISVGGDLSIAVRSGGIAQSGAFRVGGNAGFDAGAGDISLANAGNDFAGTVALRGDNVQIHDRNALTLGTLDVDTLSATSVGALGLGSGRIAGALVARSGGGAITQAGALSVGGNSAIDAGAGDISLGNAGNDFAGGVDLAGGVAVVRDTDALRFGTLDIAGLTATSGGALSLGSGSIAGDLVATSHGGGIRQGGALLIAGASTIDAGTGNITLADAGNDFAGTVSLGGAAVSIHDRNALTLGTLDVDTLSATSVGALGLGSGRIAGALVARSGGGAITQAGALSVGGASTIDAGIGAITLSNGGNDFAGRVSLAGGAVTIRDTRALSLGQVDATSLHATAATIGLGSDITTSGDQHYDGALVLDGDVVLRAGGDVAFGATVDGAHRLSANAGGAVVFDAAVGGTTALSGLDVEAGSFDAASTISVGGDLSIAVRSGGIAQSGAFRVGGNAGFDAGAGDISLGNAGNDFAGGVGLSGGAIALRDRNDLTLSQLRSAPGRDVHVVAGGALALPAQAIDAGSGSLHLAAHGDTLTTRGTLAGGDVGLHGAGGVVLAGDVLAQGRLHLESGGDLLQSGGRVAAALLTGSAAGEARLAGANRIAELGAFSASGIHLASTGPLALTGPVGARAGSLLLALSEGDLAIDGHVSAADIRLEIAGGIGQGADGQLVAGTLSGRAGGEVNLGDGQRFIDNQIERIGDFTARAGFSMTNGRSLTLSSLNGSDFTIDAGEAEFYVSVHGDLRQDGTDWLYNGRGTWVASGGIGLHEAPIHVMGVASQVATPGVPPAYFNAVRRDGSLVPIVGDAVNVPSAAWAGRAQTSSNRQVAYVDVGADASNYRGYGLVEPGVRLPQDQQPECDPDFPGPDCADTAMTSLHDAFWQAAAHD